MLGVVHRADSSVREGPGQPPAFGTTLKCGGARLEGLRGHSRVREMTSDAGSAAAAIVPPQAAAAAPAAATKGKQPARRKPLTLPEMRSKAAFRACDRCAVPGGRGLSCGTHFPQLPGKLSCAALTELCCAACVPAACRLMERGADSQEQLWSVARVMSGEEYEQVS